MLTSLADELPGHTLRMAGDDFFFFSLQLIRFLWEGHFIPGGSHCLLWGPGSSFMEAAEISDENITVRSMFHFL